MTHARRLIGGGLAALALAALAVTATSRSAVSGESQLRVAQAEGTDAEFWSRVKDSDDPVLLELYIRAFPTGEHVPEAHARIKALQSDGPAGKGTGSKPVAEPDNDAQKGKKVAGESGPRTYLPGEGSWIGAEITSVLLDAGQSAAAGQDEALRVVSLVRYGPGKKAGLKQGDIILALDGEKVGSVQDFVKKVSSKGPGKNIALRLFRDGNVSDLPVTLGGRLTDSIDAANAGDAEAQLQVGYAYATGSGVAQDAEKGFSWYMKSAKQGNMHALHNVGNAYFYGRGVAKDQAQAVPWYRRAGEKGHANAQTHMGYAYANGIGVPRNDFEAVEWYRKAIAQGEPFAMNNLALFYEDGRGGLLKSKERSIELLRRAAGQGNDLAKQNLEKRGIPVFDPAEMQRALADLGFDPGPVDGKMGRKTQAAIRDAQKQLGLAVDGKGSLELLKSLQQAAASGGPDPSREGQPAGGGPGGTQRTTQPSGTDNLGDLDALE